MITNTGRIAADEVIQLYLSRQDISFRVPLFDLHGFQRIRLAPGEIKTVLFRLAPEDFLLVNEEGEPVYIPGKLRIFLGGSLPGSRSAELGAGPGVMAEITLQ